MEPPGTSATSVVERTLAGAETHAEWESRYRVPEAVRFQDEVVDHLARLIGANAGSELLDVGCGSGTNAIRFARRGVKVRAIDSSKAVLEEARANVRAAGVADLVSVEHADLRSLPIEDASVRFVLCWGVLMHVPEVELALAELARVLEAGGTLVVVEGNLHAPDEVALRIVDRLGRTTRRLPILNRLGPTLSTERRPAGMERWRETPGGPLFARRMDLGWLERTAAGHGLTLRRRLPHQFTEAFVYARSGSPVARIIHTLNDVWFHVVRTPRLASANVLVFERGGAVRPASRWVLGSARPASRSVGGDPPLGAPPG